MKKKYIILFIAIVVMCLGIAGGYQKISEFDRIEGELSDMRMKSEFSGIINEGNLHEFCNKDIILSKDVKINLRVTNSKLEKGIMNLTLTNESGKVIFEKSGNTIDGNQVIEMPKGKYNFKITLEDAVNGKLNLYPKIIGIYK